MPAFQITAPGVEKILGLLGLNLVKKSTGPDEIAPWI